MKRILFVAAVAVGLMAIIDGVISPGYFLKSIAKIVLFLVLPIAAGGAKINPGSFLRPSGKREIISSVILGAGVYLSIMGAYLLFSPYLDLDRIRALLGEQLGVVRDNFILVAIYISFVNSLLEEFFFRGFIFLGLLGKTTRLNAYFISAGIFAVYHLAILKGWFGPLIFALSMIGLFVGGLIFNKLNERNGNILSSWLVHMMANLAINTIGLMMFGIL
jgi:membrane protease YdiL (CAAX protease family)